jgi:hypothetical protein
VVNDDTIDDGGMVGQPGQPAKLEQEEQMAGYDDIVLHVLSGFHSCIGLFAGCRRHSDGSTLRASSFC